MFDIGFAELLIIGVVALLVIGPERMPDAVRTGAAWLNRLRRGFNDIKHEVQQELHNDAVLRDLRDSGKALRDETDNLRQQFQNPLGDKKEPAAPDSAATRDGSSPRDVGESGGPADDADAGAEVKNGGDSAERHD